MADPEVEEIEGALFFLALSDVSPIINGLCT